MVVVVGLEAAYPGTGMKPRLYAAQGPTPPRRRGVMWIT